MVSSEVQLYRVDHLRFNVTPRNFWSHDVSYRLRSAAAIGTRPFGCLNLVLSAPSRLSASFDNSSNTLFRTGLPDRLHSEKLIDVVSHCCFSVDTPAPPLNTNPYCAADAFRSLCFGIGMVNLAQLLFSPIFWVVCPVPSNSPNAVADTRRVGRIGWS